MPPMTTTAAGTQTQLELLPISPTLTLRLRAPSVESRRIRWAEDVIDNEGLGRKKSKVCCIYHKPRRAGESSSESDSSSDDGDDGSDDENDDGRARMAGKGKKTHEDCGGGGEGKGCDKGGRVKTKRKKRNGYETEPKRGGDKGKKTML